MENKKMYSVGWYKNYYAQVLIEAHSESEAIEIALGLQSDDERIDISFLDNDSYEAEEVTY